MVKYNTTDRQLHWLCQILAKANRTFVPKKENDSHTNLYFDSLGNRINGRWIETKSENLLFTLNLDTLSIEIINNSQNVLATFPSIGKQMPELEKEISSKLHSLGLNSTGFTDELHFEIPEYNFAKSAFEPIEKTALAEWKSFRELANEACVLLQGYLQTQEEIRIWPHHFDTGFYTKINSNLGLGFGLAMCDTMAGSPYFYLSGYALIGSINYENLPQSEEWTWEIEENWKGAILPLNSLLNKSDIEQKIILNNYMTEAFKWYVVQF